MYPSKPLNPIKFFLYKTSSHKMRVGVLDSPRKLFNTHTLVQREPPSHPPACTFLPADCSSIRTKRFDCCWQIYFMPLQISICVC